MTWSMIPRIAGVTALACASLLICVAQAQSTVAYVDGTIASIPVNSPGDLNLSEKIDLRFEYGGGSFAVPYNRITEIFLGRDDQGLASQIKSGASKLGQTVLPMLFDGSDRSYVTVRFRNAANTDTQRLVFQRPANQAMAVIPAVKEKAPGIKGTMGSGAIADDTETWWGNQVWKTERNKHLWASSQEEPEKDDKVKMASREE